MLLRINEQRNILHEIRKRKANWIGHILRRNCLLKQVIEGKIKGEIEVTRRRGRRRKKLLDDLKDRRGYSHLKEEALDRTMWRHRFGGGFVPVVRQNSEWTNEDETNHITTTTTTKKTYQIPTPSPLHEIVVLTLSVGVKGKGKAVPLQAWSGPEGSRKLRFPDFMTTAQDASKVVRLTHRPPLTPGNAHGTHFC